MHKGTDYAAASGTPVRAIGDGVVVRGLGSGYGNVLEIRHRNGYVTRYGHLSRFAPGVRAGARVDIGQTVAFVGSTGLEHGAAPALRSVVNGQQRDPRAALSRRRRADPRRDGARSTFARARGSRSLGVARRARRPASAKLAPRRR